MIKTTSSLPPPILQYFDRLLLSKSVPKFYDDAHRLYEIYQYIKRKLQKKTYCCPFQDKKFIELERKFLGLYESALEKEKEFKEKTGEHFGEPMYHFAEAGRHYKWLFNRLRFKR